MLGLNIFTDAFYRMKHILFFIFLFISLGLTAQVRIEADVTTGCNPLQVSFSIQPVSARDSIIAYEWNFGNWISLSIEMSPITKFDQLGSFDVSCIVSTIDSSYTITKRDSANLMIINVMNCNDSLYIPNVFSPNDDNQNDFFKIDTDGTSVYTFSVYTRSRTLVYKSKSPTIIWDGRSLSGQKMKNGIYFYIISRPDEVPLKEVKGIVYLFE
jgi:gliding motility-associated-like protein